MTDTTDRNAIALPEGFEDASKQRFANNPFSNFTAGIVPSAQASQVHQTQSYEDAVRSVKTTYLLQEFASLFPIIFNRRNAFS